MARNDLRSIFVPFPMTSGPPYSIPFSRGTARVEDRPTWIRLSLIGFVLFGPLRLAMILAGRSGRRGLLHRLERFWSSAVIDTLDVHLTVTGVEHIEPGEQYLVAPLHEGLADPLVLAGLPIDLSFAARDELFSWRLLGPYLRASDQTSISTDSGPVGFRALLRGAAATFARGESFVAFPQGSILGVEAGFYAGPFRAAERLGRPVLPVVVSGTHRVWEYPYGPTLRPGQSVRVTILTPIPPEFAVERMRRTERLMKRIALTGTPSPRRYSPERDGWWDAYRFRIDADFGDLARRVEQRRKEHPVAQPS